LHKASERGFLIARPRLSAAVSRRRSGAVRHTGQLASASGFRGAVSAPAEAGAPEFEQVVRGQQLADADDDPAILLSPCDLYAETGAWDEIVDAAAGIQDEDDVTLEVRLLQARALREQVWGAKTLFTPLVRPICRETRIWHPTRVRSGYASAIGRMTPKNSEVDRRIALPAGPRNVRISVGTRLLP
jgi:hypothetical protein